MIKGKDINDQVLFTQFVSLLLLCRASRASSIRNSIAVGFKGALELPFGIWEDFWGDFLIFFG